MLGIFLSSAFMLLNLLRSQDNESTIHHYTNPIQRLHMSRIGRTISETWTPEPMDDVPGRLNLSLDVEGGSLDEQATDGDRWHHQAALWPSGRSGRGQTGITRRHSCAPDLSTTRSALPDMDSDTIQACQYSYIKYLYRLQYRTPKRHKAEQLILTGWTITATWKGSIEI